MSRIQSKNTQLESSFLKKLSAYSHKAGFRYRKHYKGLVGKPDVAFPSKKVAIFIDGCFWHGCRTHSRTPFSNVAFWEEKLNRNRKRDREITRKVKKAGWKIVRIWEHTIKKRPTHAVEKIMKALENV